MVRKGAVISVAPVEVQFVFKIWCKAPRNKPEEA